MVDANEKSFLLEFANLIEKYNAEFYYTNQDDRIHIRIDDKSDCFVGFSPTPAELRKTSNDEIMTTTHITNDETIVQLIDTINELNVEIVTKETQLKRTSWCTTCSVQLTRDNVVNLQIASLDQVKAVAMHIATQVVAQREATTMFAIKFDTVETFQGFPVADWVIDVNKRQAMIVVDKQRKNLAAMQKRATELLSIEQKRGIELQELLQQMKDLNS